MFLQPESPKIRVATWCLEFRNSLACRRPPFCYVPFGLYLMCTCEKWEKEFFGLFHMGTNSIILEPYLPIWPLLTISLKGPSSNTATLFRASLLEIWVTEKFSEIANSDKDWLGDSGNHPEQDRQTWVY